MRRTIPLITIMTALLFIGIGSSAYAADAKDFPITGAVDLGVRNLQEGDASAKFQEYRDVKTGVFTNMRFGGDNGSYYMNMTGENVGRDDQFFEVKGGQYGSYDYSVHYNEIIHNLSFGAKTFYANPGSSNLSYGYANGSDANATYTPTVPTNAADWNTFDYSVKRKDTGAAMDFSFGTPFFVSLDANQIESKGVIPWGVRSALRSDKINSGNTFNQLDVPMPIDSRTNNLNLKAGYNTKKYTLSLGGSLSKFDNKNPYVTFRNPYVSSESQSEYVSEAADNDYYKLSAQGSVRQLPLNSALALQVGYSQLKNDVNFPTTLSTSTNNGAANPTYSSVTLTTNKPSFSGDITYQTASVALTSQPVKALDTKVYYNYLRKENKSDIITFTNTTSVSTEVYNYRKSNFGADVGYKFSPKTKATVGYEFQQVDRTRVDADNTTDNSAYAEVKNSSLSWLTAKVKYQRLWRSTDFQDGANADNATWRYLRKYDQASKVQDTIKLALDIDPLENLTVGLEYAYKHNDYQELWFGRTNDKRNEYYVDISYDIPERAKLTAFFDYETVRMESLFRSSTSGSPTPWTTSTSSNYNINMEQRDNNYAYGLGLQAPVIKNKLDFIASWMYEQANGMVDYSTPNDWGAATYIDSLKSNDYRKQSVNLKAIYKAVKNLDLTFGYSYEHYAYHDPSMDGYKYVTYSGTEPNNWFTGAYTDQNYNVNLFYVMAGYTF